MLILNLFRRKYASANYAIIGPDNDSSPSRRQAIIWAKTGILLIGPWGINPSENLIEIYIFIDDILSSVKLRPFCLGHNVLTGLQRVFL